MSEPNSPLKPQAEPELESSLDWWNPFPELTDAELAASELATSESAQAQPEEVPLTVPVNPGVIPAASSSEPVLNPSEPPNLIDLISLIQELNQCNGVLLDRVSQLEEALERSQQALQGQIERSPETFAATQADPAVADHEAAASQIASLFSQLEFAHQTNQRQHILIETLTAELESNQERVAQLEREAALLQQRYNEQTQLLTQSEGSCRDLQARLQRQQRYTLQFKAALEKCLEMPMPQTGADMMVPPSDGLLLPKAQQIQPWSQVTAQESLLPWMRRFKATADMASLETEPEALAAAELLPEIPAELPFTQEMDAIEETVLPKLSAVQLPVLAPLHAHTADAAEDLLQSQSEQNSSKQNPLEQNLSKQPEWIEPAHAATPDPLPVEMTAPEAAPSASISYDLKAPVSDMPPNTLLTHIDAVVQPLADRLAEALLFQATGIEGGDTEMPAAAEPIQSEMPAIMPVEFPVENDAVMDDAVMDDGVIEDVIISDPDSLLASAMSEAEDALWQDLARLMEGSTEEAVKASLTGDLAAFESLNFEGIAASAVSPEPELPAPAPKRPVSEPQQKFSSEVRAELPFASNQAASFPPAAAVSHPGTAELQTPVSSAREATAPVVVTNPNSPSPLLHPFRQTKAKRSLSSVELPSFLRQEDSKPLPT